MGNCKLYYYGIYQYREMKRPKMFIVGNKDSIPCTALHPIYSAISFTKKNILSRAKETCQKMLSEWKPLKQ